MSSERQFVIPGIVPLAVAEVRYRSLGRRGTDGELVRVELARDLLRLGDDFAVYADVKGPLVLPYRPERLSPESFRWPDCFRSIWWGLAKRGYVPGEPFGGILLRLSEGDVSCLPVAADALEENGCTDAAVLHLLRKPR